MKIRIDRKLLKLANKVLSKDLMAFKKAMRVTGYQPTTRDHRKVFDMKQTATILCAIMAHSRGRIHLTKYRPRKVPPSTPLRPMTMEEQAELIKEVLPVYLLVECPHCKGTGYVRPELKIDEKEESSNGKVHEEQVEHFQTAARSMDLAGELSPEALQAKSV